MLAWPLYFAFLILVFPMSDLATQYDDGVFEPDEETLISALRNQDDIPILMDIVAETVPVSSDKSVHSAQPLDEPEEYGMQSEKDLLEDHDFSSDSAEGTHDDDMDDVLTLNDIVDESPLSQALIAKAIASVLERRLPELVSEVMQALQDAAETKKE